MYTVLPYPHTRVMTLGVRRASPSGQLQVSGEVQVKRYRSDGCWESPPPSVSSFWKGRLLRFWAPSPALSVLSVRRSLRPVTPKPPAHCSPFGIPPARAAWELA